MRITKGKVHDFAYDLYVTSTARRAEKELGMDFEVAKKRIKKVLPKDKFVCEGISESFPKTMRSQAS